MEEEKNITRLVVDLPTATHKLIKAECAWRGQSIKQYVIKAIVDKLATDERLNKPADAQEL